MVGAVEEAGVGLASERVRRMHALLRPRSVAVIGASPNPSFVSLALRNLRRFGYTGQVVAINPRYSDVGGAACYPSLLEVPHAVDLAVVGVAARFIPQVLSDAEQKGLGALEVITSGFAETGPEGACRQAELSDWSARTGIVVGGPNCLGLMHVPSGMIALPSTFERMVPGKVGLVLQSGMMAPSVLSPMFARGIGVTFAVTSGNEADLELADYIEYFVEDEETRVIGCFAEQIKTPRRFIDACTLAAEREKPIVMLKIGRSEAAQRAALAHTGSLVGADQVVDALLRKLGVSRVASVDELLEQLAIFQSPRLPRGSGVAAIIVSGGAAGLLSDLAPDAGVSFPPLPEHTAAALREIVPEFGSVGNPLDVTGQAVFQTEILERSLDLLAETPGVDVIVYGRSHPAVLDRQSPVGKILEQAIERNPNTVFVSMALVGGHFYPAQNPEMPPVEPVNSLGDIPFLQGSEYGLRAIAALIRYADFLRLRLRTREPPPRRSPASHPHQTILADYGIPTPRETLATSVDDALAAAAAIGYPVVLKIESPDIAHKTEAGGVALNIADDASLHEAYEQVLATARAKAPSATIAGVLVQEMVTGGTELIVGMSRDPKFGPVIAVGLGGIFVEVLKDVQFLLPPLSEPEIRLALQRLRGYPVLHGARGKKPADLDALVDVLLRFSSLCLDVGDSVDEIDLNPLIVLPAGQGVRAVDCLIVPATKEEEHSVHGHA